MTVMQMKINENKIRGSKNVLINLLKEINLLDEINYTIPGNSFEKSKFSKEFISISQKGKYKEIYDCAMQNKDYDFRLKDNSIMQFTIEKENKNKIIKLRYAFYKCPYLIFEKNESEGTDIFLENYVSIRYDYDISEYKEIIHPISHLHIGNDNNLRIPIDKILEPLEFGVFIVRNIYKKEWELLLSDNKIRNKYIRLKEKFESLEDDLFTNEERKFLYLG